MRALPLGSKIRLWPPRIELVTPGEPTLLLLVGAIVGVYAGLASGLFANAIAFFQLLFFRTAEWTALFSLTEAGELSRARLIEGLAATRWHVEFLLVGLCFIVGCLVLDRVAHLRPFTPGERVPGGERPFLTLAELLGAGLALFYPLTLLAALNRTFAAPSGGFASILAQAPWWSVLLVPCVGGLAVGLLVHHLSPESKGHGVAEVIEAVAVRGGHIPASLAIWKSLTAALTIGSGGSVGREGPVVQVGSAVGSAIGEHLSFSRANVLVLVGAGAAAGIAGSFHAPIAGAMFAAEIILLDFGVRAFTPIVLASVTAVITSQSLIGGVEEIVRPAYELVSGLEIGAYAMLGILAGLASAGYVFALHYAEDAFAGRRLGRLGRWLGSHPAWLKPAIGGLILGAIGLLLPQALGTGYATMNGALVNSLGFGVLLATVFVKTLATSLTLGSGGSGGSFFPSMVIGAALGGAFGHVIHMLFPASTAAPGAYALVGMGALIAGSTLAPLTGIVMLFELTGNYEIILPLMVACVIASTLMQRLRGGSIYTLKLAARGIQVRPTREEAHLRRLRVASAMTREVESIDEHVSLRDVLQRITETTFDSFPVLDEKGRLVGLLSVEDVRAILYEDGLTNLVVAGELARPPGATLFEDEDLGSALEKIVSLDVPILPVVSREDPEKLVGLLSQRDVLRALGRATR